MAYRGDHELLTTAPGKQLDNPYSLNTVDVCPVGALTAKDFRFAMRAWELYTTPSVCAGCATGCNVEVHHVARAASTAWCRARTRRSTSTGCATRAASPTRRSHAERLAAPRVGGVPVDWDRALDDAGKKLRAALDADAGRGRRGVHAQATNEDLYAAREARLRAPAASARRTWRGRDQGWQRRHPASAPT